MKTKDIIEDEDRYQLGTYNKLPIVLVEGKGMKVRDSEDNEYIDFYGGHAVSILGHSHPNVVNAINEQSKDMIFYSNAVYSDTRSEAVKKLTEVSPKDLNEIFFCNSGSEANETALKIARKYTGKKNVISMKNSFHGRTIGSLSVTGIDKYRKQFSPKIEEVRFAEFGDIDNVKQKVDDQTAAIILEPVQSVGGMVTAAATFFHELRELCDEKDILLIFDEIQTGFGRTGKMFASDYYGVQPDMITCAKGMAAGFPIGAVFIHGKIAETIDHGEHGSTFGGGPLACAAAKSTVKTLVEEELPKNASEIGRYINHRFQELDAVEEIRGIGLLKGIKLDLPASDVQKELLDRGFIVGTTAVDDRVLRLMPPLIVNKEEVDRLYEAMNDVILEVI